MLPSYDEIRKVMLEYLGDGKERKFPEILDYVAKYFNLSEEELSELLPSGTQTKFVNRVVWARLYLAKAGLIETPRRGYVRITERGLQALKENPPVIDHAYLLKFEEFRNFFYGKRSVVKQAEESSESEELTPLEVIEREMGKLNEALKDELMKKILERPPRFFEKLVLELIVKMGYGGTFEEASKVLGKSGDEGVDGVIKEDLLGLDNIYLQAKRYKPDQTIGRKEIQSFVGALHGKGSRKGIFITTASFTKEAKDYAESLKDIKVILIDGDKLIDYMIKYNLGVRVDRVIEIKKIDLDYFEEV
ncbi:MAG: restriction endonuclease [candidate division WOR-3 bacterium]